MNRKYRRLSAAALAFVFCLMVVPVTTASARNRDRFESREPIVRAPIVRIIKKIKSFLGITTEDEVPGPPHP